LQTETITASAGSNGTISPTGSVSVNYGSNQTFTLTPATGYIASMTVDGIPATLSNNTFTLSNVTTSYTVIASFALQTETLTVSAGSNGTISPSGSVSVNYGANQTFTLTPSIGYNASLTVDGTAVVLTNNTYTLSNVTTSHTVAASFTLQKETIIASAGSNGTISPTGSVSVNYGASQTFTLTPATGYTASMTVDGIPATLSNNTFTLSNVIASHTVIASFAQIGTTCPQGTTVADGCSGAQSTGSVQHTNFFTGYVPVNGNAPTVYESYSRPSWNVAGVDYPVGYSGTLKDPTVSGNLPSCAALDSNQGTQRVTVNSTPCTLDHLDFSAQGGVCVHVAGGLTGNVTFTNDKFIAGKDNGGCFELGALTVDTGAAVNMLVKYSEFDSPYAIYYPTLATSASDTNAYIYATMTGGSITMEYSAMQMCPGGCIEVLTKTGTNPTVTSEYNYVEGNGGSGYGPGLAPLPHANYSGIEITVGATLNQWTDQFDTIYLPPTSCCGSDVLGALDQVVPSGTLNSYIADHNVLIARPYGSGPVCSQPPTQPGCTYGPAAMLMRTGNASNSQTISTTMTNNYVDDTGTGMYLSNPTLDYGLFSAGNAQSSTCSGNVNLIGGTAVIGNLGDGSWHCTAATSQTETITASAGSNGTISPSGTVSVNYGANQTFTLTPATGYTASLTVDGTAVTLTGNTYTLSNVTTSHTLTASFAPATAFTIVQSSFLGGYAAATEAPQFTNNVATGELILVMAIGSGSDTITVTDSGSNTYTQIGSGITQANGQALSFWTKNTGAGGTKVKVTCHYSAHNSSELCTILDISGASASPIDAFSYSTYGGSSTATTNAFTTANNEDLLIGQILDGNGGQGASGDFTAGSGYTIITSGQIYSGGDYFANEYSTGTVLYGSHTVSFNNVVSNGQSTGPIFGVGITPSVEVSVNGSCGSANGVEVVSAPATNLCTAGSASAVTETAATTWNWTCNGISGGTTASCSAPVQPVPTNGVCGSANGANATSTPSTNLCSSGIATAVSGSGPFTWTCDGTNGGSNSATCTTSLNGACGSSAGDGATTAPATNLCNNGTASAVSGSGPFTWTCNGYTGGGSAQCTTTSSILPSYDDASANWKNAGLALVGGIPNRTTICATVNPLGGGQDDFTNIQTAINGCPAGEVVQLGAGAFTVHIADLPIHISTAISLRGTGNCGGSSSPYCQTSISVSDGALAYTGGKCGINTSNEVTCPNGGVPVIMISPAPVSPGWDYGWAKCGNGGTASGCATPLTADASQGQTTIQVTSTSNFSVGQWVLIDEASGAGWQPDPLNQWTGDGSVWAASDWLSPSGSPATGRIMWPKGENGNGYEGSGGDFGVGSTFPYTAGSPGCWFDYCDRPTAELHKIASVGAGPCPGAGCTLTFDDPLTIAFRQSGNHNAQVYGPLYGRNYYVSTDSPISFLQNAGVEDLSVLRGVNGGIEMDFCVNCWIKNTEVGYWYGGGININYSARSELNGVYVHHCANSVNSGTEYPIDLNHASTEMLITNSITNFGGKGMTARAGGAGSVVSYSYVDDTMYDSYSGIGDYWVDSGLNASHYAGPHHVLFEGDWADNMESDNTHGSSMYITFFRNQGSGYRTPFTDTSNPSGEQTVNDIQGIGWTCGNGNCSPARPAPLHVAGPNAYSYWFAFVGNVLGEPGVTTAANGWSYEGDWSSPRMFMLGWNAGPGGQDPNMNGISGSYVFLHGNYDYVTNSVHWDPTNPDQNLPNSLYLSSEPSSFTAGASCTYPWPWVTPTGSAQVQSNSCGGSGLPAKARYEAGTPFKQP